MDLQLHGDHPVVQHLATLLAPDVVHGWEDRRLAVDVDLHVGTVPTDDGRHPDVHRARRFPYLFETRTRPGGARFDLTTRSGRAIHAVEFDGQPLSGSAWTATGHLQSSRIRTRLPRALVRVVTREHDHWNDVLATILSTEVLEPVLWLALLDNDATLVHAGSVVSPAGTGVLLTGAGGAGKTPTVLSLVLEHGWRHLGDDLTIVGDAGMTHLPRPVRLAHHHGVLVEALAGHRQVPRRGRRHRVAPADLFGSDALATAAPLTTVVNLEPAPSSTRVEVATRPRADLVRRATAILCNEFWELLRFVNARAVLDPSAPTLVDLHRRVTKVLERHLPQGDVLELRIPPHTPTARVVGALQDAVR